MSSARPPVTLYLDGPLLSKDFAAHDLLAGASSGRITAPDVPLARFAAWHRRCRSTLGPASGVRAIAERGAAPLFALLGFRIGPVVVAPGAEAARLTLTTPGGRPLGLVVCRWGERLDALWRSTVRGAARDARPWAFAFAGTSLRLIDAARTFSRRHVEFDLDAGGRDEPTLRVLWATCHARCFDGGAALGGSSPIEQIVRAAADHAERVCASLHSGVERALASLAPALRRTARCPPARLHEQSLTVLYRVLFLLFAEARGVVPTWHPIYRDSYSVEHLCDEIRRDRPPQGLWSALQAVTRLAAQGCLLDDLQVPAFNGQLFSPGSAPAAERARLDDVVVRQVLEALTSRRAPRGAGLRRIAYGDLGVEQLGAIYERVLDRVPADASLEPRVPAAAPSVSRRKTTGSFYTPSALAEYLVRRTLAPLLEDRPAAAILELRVVDPAAGSGAFLVAACRYLALAYEDALVREQVYRPGDIDARARAAFRRTIAQRCLYGVDLNPMAVQLARLSMWLATLSPDLPLTFLDHRLRAGNSVVGASLDDLARQAPGRGRRREATLPFAACSDLYARLHAALPVRRHLAEGPEATAEDVREKERALAALAALGGPLTPWRRAADLWCAWWFWPDDPPDRRTMGELVARLVGRDPLLPERAARGPLATSAAVAETQRFFHWTLEFPEVFYDEGGQPRADAGFDAVLGNPPWDMVRADSGDASARAARRRSTSGLVRFARDSGAYRLSGDGHLNLYQLFVERAVSLLRPGGRAGLVVPWGLMSDHGSAPLRRHLFSRCQLDEVRSFENRRGLFPIHRGLRFAAITWSAVEGGGPVRCRLGATTAESLEAMPDRGAPDDACPIVLTPALLRRMGGDSLPVPHAASTMDVALLSRFADEWPWLASEGGWRARFGRELNGSEDRPSFSTAGPGLRVVEGKHLAPFSVALDNCRFRISREKAARILGGAARFTSARLAYRDVASAANARTLIAAVLPPGAVATHTVFCLTTALALDAQWFLCGILNSYVANYLVRLRVGTHLGSTTVERLPVPVVAAGTRPFEIIAGLSKELARHGAAGGARHARLQAAVARLYRLGEVELRHVLDTFPLVPEAERHLVLEAWRAGPA
jgi:hypothetical protein